MSSWESMFTVRWPDDYSAGSRPGNDIIKYIINNIIDKKNHPVQLSLRFESPSLCSSEREPLIK